MKRRAFISIILVWFFSQQVLAAVWAMPEADTTCDVHTQVEYRFDSNEQGEHTVSLINNTALGPHHSLTACDHGCTFCQFGLLSFNLLPSVSSGLMLFDSHVIDALVDTSFDTFYRPPIFA